MKVKEIRDKAITLQDLAKRQKLGLKIQNDVAEIRLYAERRAGEILKETVKPGNPNGTNQYEEKSNNTTIPKLKDIGITRDQSSNWQKTEISFIRLANK